MEKASTKDQRRQAAYAASRKSNAKLSSGGRAAEAATAAASAAAAVDGAMIAMLNIELEGRCLPMAVTAVLQRHLLAVCSRADVSQDIEMVAKRAVPAADAPPPQASLLRLVETEWIRPGSAGALSWALDQPGSHAGVGRAGRPKRRLPLAAPPRGALPRPRVRRRRGRRCATRTRDHAMRTAGCAPPASRSCRPRAVP